MFHDFWPEPSLSGGRPCPASLSKSQIADLRLLVPEALARAVTDGEKAVLRRLNERLALANGAALTTDASGWCNDLKPEDYHHPRPRVANLWR